jgi:DNA-binding NarL/FixJ family response regulator
MTLIRLLLVDDHILFRESLSRLLASEPDLQIVGECGSASEGLAILAEKPVDLVLLDYDLGEHHGNSFLIAAREMGYQGKFLMVTAGMGTVEVSVALNHGASGIFHKHNPPGSLTRAIRMVAAGEVWVDQKLIQSLADRSARREDHTRRQLTAREQAVLRGLLEGSTNKEIAAQLFVSESAIKATLQQLFHKTGVRTRSQLVRIAIENSLATRPRVP